MADYGSSQLVGRERERQVLAEALESRESELVAVYGRRRVGKTFLVRQFVGERMAFELVGSREGDMQAQLASFARSLTRATSAPTALTSPASWQEAFAQLESAFEKRSRGQKRVVFFDEVPWLATRRSGFLSAFEHFWNSWASRQNDLVVIICGSAASWMLRKVVSQRGGLHNRVTRRIRLQPFTLKECEAYLGSRGVKLGRYQTLELYMAMGGVPHYLKQVRRGESAAQNIDRMCFSSDGLLRGEMDDLYPALFEKPERHEQVVQALVKKKRGMTRQQIVEATSLSSGGTTSKVLAELEESGFVVRTSQYDKHLRDAVYRLNDEYTLFYYTWIAKHRGQTDGAWQRKQNSPAMRAWSGLSFEAACLKHVAGIARALGISGVDRTEATWLHRGSEQDEGAQIDLLIDRADRTINLCEMKFSETTFTISRAYGRELARKADVFRRVTGTRKALLLTLVTTYGVVDNQHARDLGVRGVTMDALFEV